MASQFPSTVRTSTAIAAIISRTPGSMAGIRAIIDHPMVVIILIATAIINVVAMFPEAIIEAIIEAITRDPDAGEDIIADIAETTDITSAQSMREAFMGFPRFIFSRR